MLWSIFLLLLIVYTISIRWKNRKFHKIHKQHCISLKQVPILGHALHFLGDGKDRMNMIKLQGREIIEKRDGIGSLWLVNRFFVIIADPEAAEVVLKTCLEKDDIFKVSRILIGSGSTFAPGSRLVRLKDGMRLRQDGCAVGTVAEICRWCIMVPIWRPRRKIVAPIFRQTNVNSFLKIFSTQSEIMMEHLKTVAGNGDFPIIDKVTKYSMDTICENVLGVTIKAQSVPSHPVPLAFNQFCLMVTSRTLRPWLHSDKIYKWTRDYPQFETSVNILKEFVAKIIKSKRNEVRHQKIDLENHEYSKTKSFLQIMLEEGVDKGLNDLELQEETLVILLAATDTTAISSSFMCLMLAKHPDIQEKVYQEIIEVIGDSERHIEPNDLPKLKYLEAVMKETLRLYPPAPIIIRKVEKNVTLPSNVTLVPGVGAALHIWAIQRNPKYWGSDANIFRPERFLEGHLKHPYSFMAFSNGPRNCIGALYATAAIKTLMSHLLRKYRILPSSSSDNTEDELPTAFEVTMKHVHNFEIQLELNNKVNY